MTTRTAFSEAGRANMGPGFVCKEAAHSSCWGFLRTMVRIIPQPLARPDAPHLQGLSQLARPSSPTRMWMLVRESGQAFSLNKIRSLNQNSWRPSVLVRARRASGGTSPRAGARGSDPVTNPQVQVCHNTSASSRLSLRVCHFPHQWPDHRTGHSQPAARGQAAPGREANVAARPPVPFLLTARGISLRASKERLTKRPSCV